MKIVTWNINGIRTFKSGIKQTLDSFDADIICVQETKVTRDLLEEKTAIVEGYNSYFSFSRGRSGYSGVATYCKDSATPQAAEEGLTGLLTNHEGAVGCYGDQAEFSSEELQLLDNEGRAMITQHRITCQKEEKTVTVINVYCPRADPEKPERKQFKLQFYKLLQCRAEALLSSGSHVIIVGDVNTSHRPIDHCDPTDIEDFDENPGRKWLNGFLHCDRTEDGADEDSEKTGGKFVDSFRYFHPTQTNAFTCWSTLTGARQTNYGTRIDYIFADRQLIKGQFVTADIMPEVEGSDHCPVWGQLSCAVLPCNRPPPLCTRYLPEFTGKQLKLSHFLVKVEQKLVHSVPRDGLPGSQEEEERRENLKPVKTDNVLGKKRVMTSVVPKGKKPKTVPAPQSSLFNFFKPKVSNSVDPVKQCINTDNVQETASAEKSDEVSPVEDVLSESFSDHHAQTDPETNASQNNNKQVRTQHPSAPPTVGHSNSNKQASQVFWKSVLQGPPPPPSCKVHGEPCVLRTVKKEGPNMGKQFFVCARPQGHASNVEARCNFFAWVERGKGCKQV